MVLCPALFCISDSKELSAQLECKHLLYRPSGGWSKVAALILVGPMCYEEIKVFINIPLTVLYPVD